MKTPPPGPKAPNQLPIHAVVPPTDELDSLVAQRHLLLHELAENGANHEDALELERLNQQIRVLLPRVTHEQEDQQRAAAGVLEGIARRPVERRKRLGL